MNRLTKHFLQAAVFSLLVVATGGNLFAQDLSKKSICIEDERYRVEVSRAHGTVSRILDKERSIELIREPRLADNFRFTLPIPGKEPWQTIEANYIRGDQQKLSSFDRGAKKLALHWAKPLKNCLGEKFDASAEMNIELTDKGVLFTLNIDNRTRYQIGEVFFPLIGGIQGIGKTRGQLKATQMIRPAGTGAVSNETFRAYTNMAPLGDQGPEQFYSYPKDMPELWVDFACPGLTRSVCMGAHDSSDRPKALRLELIPGVSDTMREDGNWPRPPELKGRPVGISVCFADFPFAPANTTFEAAPVLVTFHDGGWSEAKQIFQTWKRPK